MKPLHILRSLLLLGIFLFMGKEQFAAHISGGEITYKTLSGDTVEITLTYYWDCNFPGAGPPTENRVNRRIGQGNNCNGTRFFSSCGAQIVPTYTLTNVGGTEVSQLCPTATSTCQEPYNGSQTGNPGVEEYIFRDTIVLDTCDTWHFMYNEFARSTSTNIPASDNGSFLIEAVYNRNVDSVNTSPVFATDPIPYYCTGTTVTYSFGISDADGDSLGFKLVAPETMLNFAGNPGTGTCAGVNSTLSTGTYGYASGYSSAEPIDGLSSLVSPSALNGNITFTPATQGAFIVVLEVTDYDSGGNAKGTVRRDFQIIVQACASNGPPTPRAGGVYNVGVDGNKIDSSSVEVIAGDSLCFDVRFIDPDAGDTVTISTDASTVLSGSTESINDGPDSADVTICWRSGSNSPTPFAVTVEVRDDNCPINNINAMIVEVYVRDTVNCNSYTELAQSCSDNADGELEVNHSDGIGPYGYVWKKNGVVDPTLTTKKLTGIKSTDSYSVQVIDSFNNTSCQMPSRNIAQVNDITIITDSVDITNLGCDGSCVGEIEIREVVGGTASGAGPLGYSYAWSGTSDTTNHPQNLCGGKFFVTVSDTRACDTVYAFYVTSPPSFTSSIVDSVDVLCKGDSTGEATVRSIVNVCGITTDTCDAVTRDTVGTGTNTNSRFDLPSPFGRFNKVKQQYLIRASELTAQGMASGTKISKLAFLIDDDRSIVSFQNYEINMGCTSADSLPSNSFVGGLFNVYSTASQSVPFVFGPTWHEITFDNSFVWDGDSNLVVELCWNNSSSNPVLINAEVFQTTTSYRSYNAFQSQNADACLSDTATESGFERPHMRFGYCESEYTYSWTSGETDSVATGLWAATHFVTVTNEEGCEDTVSVVISEPAQGLQASMDSIINVSCAGDSSGYAKATVSGGTAPYTFTWSAGTAGVHDSIRVNLTTGVNYTVTITDNNGCDTSITFSLTALSNISISIVDSTSILCFGDNNGRLVAAVDSGAPAYTFTWVDLTGGSSVTTGASDSIAINLGDGTYRVIVEDSEGCRDSTEATLTEPTDLTSAFTDSTLLNCNGDTNGMLTITPSGGTPGYTYTWGSASGGSVTTGTSDSIAINLGADTFVVIIVDANGCRDTNARALSEPTAMTLTFTDSSTVSCPGGNDGSLTVTPVGGTPGYSFAWGPGAITTGATDSIAINLTSNTFYRVTVTDANSCTAVDSMSLSDPVNGVSIAFTDSTQVQCNGTATGSLTGTPSNGTAPYTFAWVDVTGGSSVTTGASDSIAINLSAGTYRIIVTDNNGCQDSADFTLSDPTNLSVTFTDSTQIDCNGNATGSLTATPAGGTPGYTYIWTNATAGVPDSVGINISGGVQVKVVVTDNNGCQDSAMQTMTDPPALTVSFTDSTSVTCNGLSNGQVTATPNGGTPGYTFAWTNATAGVPDSIGTNITGGTLVTVTVTDNNSCTAQASITLQDPPLLTAQFTDSTQISCPGDTNGSFTVTPSGGTPGYTYSWSRSGGGTVTTGATDSIAINLGSGEAFTVTVTDSRGCTTVVTDSLADGTTGLALSFTDSSLITCFGLNNGSLTVTPTSGTGPFTFTWTNVTSGGAVSTGASDSIAINLGDDTYRVVVSDGGGCTDSLERTFTEPTDLSVSFTDSTSVDCNGNNTGSLTATPNGGTPGYTYAWTNATAGVPDSVGINITGGSLVKVVVTDNNGCQDSAQITLDDPPLLTATFTDSTSVGCAGANTGSVTITPSGGTPGYTYAWNNATAGSPDSIGINISGGNTVTVTVTDANLCAITRTIVLRDPPGMNSLFTDSTTLNCPGDSTGSLTVTPVGGTGPFTYAWTSTPSGTVQTGTSDSIAINLTSGVTYQVVITDNNSCTDTVVGTISAPTAVIAQIFDSVSIACAGDTNGRLFGRGVSGASPYDYAWKQVGSATPVDTGVSDSIAIMLGAGTYRLIVTDNNGCQDSTDKQLVDPTILTGSFTDSTALTCTGSPTAGSLTVTPVGGTPGYSYTWGPGAITTGATDSIAINLSASILYSVTITDANNCTVVVQDSLQDPANFAVNFTSIIDPLCNGDSTGQLIITPNSGTPPFTYAWNIGTAGATDSIRTGLPGGVVVRVTVTDNGGCQDSSNITLTDPLPITTVWTDSTTINCFGDANGSVTITPFNGQQPYTFNWTPAVTTGASDSIAINLSGGVQYVVQITDNNLCSVSDTITLSTPTQLTSSFTNVVNLTCNGDTNGTATITPGGGTPNYNFTWAAQGGGTVDLGTSDSIAINLSADDYRVTVTDARGCTVLDTVTISEPLAITGTINTVNSACGAATGSASIDGVTGGTGPYTFAWDSAGTPLGITNDTATGLRAGTYNVVVTDSVGCTASFIAVVNDQGAPVITLDSLAHASCDGVCNGAISVSITSSNGSVTPVWSNGATTEDISNLCDTIYTLTATDSAGCISFFTDTVLNLDTIDLSFATVPLSCGLAVCDGEVRVTPTGGTTPYNFVWSTAVTDTLDSITNLCAGIYTVTVTDPNGCTAIDSATLNNPSTFTLSMVVDSASCNGSSDGVATVSVTGGAAPFNYQWSTSLTDTLDSVTGLAAGQYFVTVTASDGCTGVDTAVVQEPDTISASFVTVPADCGVSNGRVTATPSGGNGGYSYVWPVGGVTTNSTDTGYAAGNYTVLISDSKGCNNTLGFTITNLNAPIITLDSIVDESCPGACDGGIFVTVSGGNPAYNPLWNDPSATTTQDIDSVCPGIYTLQITDQLNCMSFYTDTIEAADTIQTTTTVIAQASNISTCDGQAFVTHTGGVTPFQYLWTGGETNDTALALCVGTNYVTVTDANGCTVIDSVVITAPSGITIDSSNVTHPDCGVNPCNGSVFVQASGGTGPLTYSWDNGDVGQTTTLRCAGVATVTVTDGTTSTVQSFILTNPTGPAFTKNKSDVTCFGACDGEASVSVSFGSFSFLWPFNGSTNDTIGPLCPGSYEVRVTQNATGCTSVDTINIVEPQQLQASFTPTLANCGASDGQIASNVSGGTPGYTYQWLDNTLSPLVPPQTGPTATLLAAGIYNLSVTDTNNCTGVFQTTLGNINGPTVTLDSINHILCFGDTNGGIFVTTSGTPTLTYLWTGGSNSEDLTNVAAGGYTLEVTDGSGCKTFLQDTIDDATQIMTNVSLVSNVTSSTSCDGVATASVTSGGQSPFNFMWSTGASGATASNLCVGVNYVTITDNNNCSVVDSIIMTNPNQIVLDSSQSTNPVCNVCDGKVTIFVSGGVGPYTYAWDNGDSADSTTARCAGVISVTVTDNSGLSETFVFTLNDTPSPTISLAGTDASCFGLSDGQAVVTVLSGLPPLTVTWIGTTASGDTASNLSAGVYGVEVRDVIGCIASDTIAIDEPEQIDANFLNTDASCGASDGQIIAQIITSGGGVNPHSYVWLDQNQSPLVPAQTSDTLNNIPAGVYFVSITDGDNCSRVINANLSNVGGATVTLDSLNDESCPGACDGSIGITATGLGTLVYGWLPNGQTSEDISSLCADRYIVSVTDGAGCITVEAYDIAPADTFDLAVNRLTDASCDNTNDGSVDIAITGNSSGYLYNWSGPGGFTATVQDLTSVSNGDYGLTITDGNGCMDSTSVTIGIATTLTINGQQDTFICENVSTIFLRASATSTSGTVSYRWYDDLGFDIGTLPVVGIAPKDGLTQYLLEVTSGLCIQYDTVEVIYSAFVRADAGDDKEITKGEEVELGGKPSALFGDSISWTPGSTIIGFTELQNPIVKPGETTTYTLIVTNSSGCQAIDSVNVIVLPLAINDGFTPNSDGVNDNWNLPVLEDYPDATVQIYNRWGQLIFESNGYTVPWDGRYKGKDLPVGTYYYVIDLGDESLEERVITGPVTIMR